MESVLVPYIQQHSKNLSLSDDHLALVKLDGFKSQRTSNILSLHWYAIQVSKQVGKETQPVDLSMSVVKPLGATWLMKTVEYIKAILPLS